MSRESKTWFTWSAVAAFVLAAALAGRCAPSAPKAGSKNGAPAGASDHAVAAHKV